MGIIYWVVIGAVAGWLAGLLMKGKGSGLLMNMVIGIVGAFIGGWAFSLLGLTSNGLVGSLATAVFGAVILIFIAKKIK